MKTQSQTKNRSKTISERGNRSTKSINEIVEEMKESQTPNPTLILYFSIEKVKIYVASTPENQDLHQQRPDRHESLWIQAFSLYRPCFFLSLSDLFFFSLS